MAQMGRPGLSTAQKAELWQRWKQGQSLSEIGRLLGKHAGSIHGVVWRVHSFPSAAVPVSVDRSRTRKHFSRSGNGEFPPADCRAAWASIVDHQPGNPPSWWSPPRSGVQLTTSSDRQRALPGLDREHFLLR